MAGTLYGIGTGPGDPELMTLKAVKILKQCDILAIPAKNKDTCASYAIAAKAVPETADKKILCIDIPMTKDESVLEKAYEKGFILIEKQLSENRDVAFLTLGDPVVYSTYMVFHRMFIEKGYKAQIVNGVPSFCAVAAKLDIPLGSRDENIHIYPFSYNEESLETSDGTRVYMKSGRKIDKLKDKLVNLKKEGKAEVMAVSDCGMESERIYRDIETLDENATYLTTVIVRDKK